MHKSYGQYTEDDLKKEESNDCFHPGDRSANGRLRTLHDRSANRKG